MRETLECARLILRVCGYWPILSRSCKNKIHIVTLGISHQGNGPHECNQMVGLRVVEVPIQDKRSRRNGQGLQL